MGIRRSEVVELADGSLEQTFLTPAMTVGNGEIINKWLPLVWPEGKIAVQSFSADVIRAPEDGSEFNVTACCDGPLHASRQEVFLHHWTFNRWQLPPWLYKHMVHKGGMDFKENAATAITTFWADAGLNQGAAGPCPQSNLHTYFGVGDEVRGEPGQGAPYEFPEPYGVVFDADEMRRTNEFMIMNAHVIDLRNVTDVRGCTECDCKVTGAKRPADPAYSDYEGGLQCCHSTESDGSKCPLTAGTERSEVTYFIRYTLKWRPVTESTKPLEVVTLEMTDNNAYWTGLKRRANKEDHEDLRSDPAFVDLIAERRSGEFVKSACHVEYYVPACNSSSEACVHKVHNSWTLPFSGEVIFMRSHLHGAGLAMHSSMENFGSLCRHVAKYDEHARLSEITTCGPLSESLPAPVARGQKISVEAEYQQDERPHYGVMGFSVLFLHRREVSPFMV
jgi:hypothetical protein